MNFFTSDIRIKDNKALQDVLEKLFNDLVGSINAIDFANNKLAESNKTVQEIVGENNRTEKFKTYKNQVLDDVMRLFRECRTFFEELDKFKRTHDCKLVYLNKEVKKNSICFAI